MSLEFYFSLLFSMIFRRHCHPVLRISSEINTATTTRRYRKSVGSQMLSIWCQCQQFPVNVLLNTRSLISVYVYERARLVLIPAKTHIYQSKNYFILFIHLFAKFRMNIRRKHLRTSFYRNTLIKLIIDIYDVKPFFINCLSLIWLQ